MNDTMVFLRPNDLSIIENSHEFILRKGFLHVNEIIIDKDESSKKFVRVFQQFEKDKKVSLSRDDDAYDDFLKLLKFGLLGIQCGNRFLVITNQNYKKTIQSQCPDSTAVFALPEILSENEQKILREGKNAQAMEEIKENAKKQLEGYDHIYYMDDFCNITGLRSVNRLLFSLDMDSTIGFIDNDNIYLTGIKPGYTGCYECLEKHILSKFPGTMSDYESKYDSSLTSEAKGGNLLILLGMILSDMTNIMKYGSSSLTGNVVQMYTPNFEYSYNVNFKNSGCPICSGINRVHFEEQNIRSVNILKEILKDDSDRKHQTV